MKKITVLIIAFSLAFVFCGCTSNNQNTTSTVNIVDEYIKVADEYIEDGDLETAAKVLDEGISKTGNPTLQEKLDTVTKKLDEKNKAEEEKKQAEEKLNKMLGLYCSNVSLDYEITLYKSSENTLKAQVSYGRISGYFDLTDNQNGSYTFVNDGVNVITVNGNKSRIHLLYDLLNAHFFDTIPTTAKITPLTDGSEFTLTYIYANGTSYSDIFNKDQNRSDPNFAEKYY